MKSLIAFLLVFSALCASALGADLKEQFNHPPASARPWVYWFWNNGNVTKEGITADLQAMQRVGIGGVIIMDVVERFAPPPGTADFMNPQWQELFGFSVAEAHRLGLEINMTNGPGWCGSSGPWITPELSMQKMVTSNIEVQGPATINEVISQPEVSSHREHDVFNSTVNTDDYYRDIVVLAFPKSPTGVVVPEDVVDVSSKMTADGRFTWQAPAGKWIIERIGHTSTGSSTRPPVKGGNGLECDKLSREAMDVHFAGMLKKLITAAGPMVGPTFSATHIDSWEVGSQNWTPKLFEEFKKRRGYDPVPFLPDVTDVVLGDGKQKFDAAVGDDWMAARFRWDFNQTISELLADNYVGHLAELAHQYHLRLTLEGYNLPFGDEATYTQRADEPMTEFWATGGNENLTKCRQMASVAHVMGHQIVGAEAFTSGDNENWLFHPATIKALGDYEFSQGINRFVIHRYAHQPYLDRYPGATMGPWGLHYERTQTWWEMSTAWHEYLARCQFMLRQGMFVADLCYLRPEMPNQTYFTPNPAPPPGYKFDEISAEALINRMTVKDAKLVLEGGMSYRALVLPDSTLMTPKLLTKLTELVKDGATVIGPKPKASPSLSDYPKCDQEVTQLAADLWGDCDGKTVTEHRLGTGRIYWGQPLDQLLPKLDCPADFTATAKLNWVHRHLDDSEVFFVANPQDVAQEVRCTFRVKGMRPELWDPQTGQITQPAMYEQADSGVTLPMRFDPSGSCFVIFRPDQAKFDAVVSFNRDGQPVIHTNGRMAVTIESATYGVPDDAKRTRDVKARLQGLVDAGTIDFKAGDMAQGDDPAFGIVKTLAIEYSVDGNHRSLSAHDPEDVHLVPLVAADEPAAEIQCGDDGELNLVAQQAGHYQIKTAGGKTLDAEVATAPASTLIKGPWAVSFPPNWGAPERITLDNLLSLSDSPQAGVKYFSGTATYTKDFDWTAAATGPVWLDLGDVAVMAQVKVNGRDLGIVWKAPYRVDIAQALKSGTNTLEFRVANLWPNRMIGDAASPSAKPFTWSSYEPFNKDSALPKSGLLGPVTIQQTTTVRFH